MFKESSLVQSSENKTHFIECFETFNPILAWRNQKIVGLKQPQASS